VIVVLPEPVPPQIPMIMHSTKTNTSTIFSTIPRKQLRESISVGVPTRAELRAISKQISDALVN